MSRIIYLTVRTPLGTGEEFIMPEMLELVQNKHTVLIVPRSPSGPQVTQAEAASLQPYCRYQPLLSWRILQASVLEIIRTPIKCLRLFLRILFGSGKPLHLLKNLAVFPKALWLGRLARTWGAEHIYAHWALTTATMAMIAGEITGIPWSFTAHRGDIVMNNMLDVKAESAAFVRITSHNLLSLVQSIVKNKMPDKLKMLYMGVHLSGKPPSHEKSNEKPFTIMSPASFIPRKGHDYLFQAVAELKARGLLCQLLLAGQGPLAGVLKLKVSKLNIQDCVQFLGHLSHNKLLEYYEKGLIDLVVLASCDKDGPGEGMAVSLIEAMGHGIPVIATPVGGNPELIVDGTGILVPPQDSNALANAIEKLITDPALRRNLAMAGHKRVMENFNVKTVTESLCSLMLESSYGRAQNRAIA